MSDRSVRQTAGNANVSSIALFFSSRWRGEIPLAKLFWRDMIFFGIAINVLMMLVAVILLGAKAPLPLSLAVFFLPVPYNLFLFLSVWRTAESTSIRTAGPVRTAALVWLIAATVL